jgi:hypothetical protein
LIICWRRYSGYCYAYSISGTFPLLPRVMYAWFVFIVYDFLARG